MTDPMNALIGLQRALDSGVVRPRPGDLHSELAVIFDEPNGTPRFTYALVGQSSVQAIALFVRTDPVQGIHCFNIGYAVVEAARRKGLGSKVLGLALDELKNGLGRAGIAELYVEAVVSTDNAPSNKLASKLISGQPDPGVDSFTGEPMLHYLKKIELRA